jgi:serine/threonine protein kinase
MSCITLGSSHHRRFGSDDHTIKSGNLLVRITSLALVSYPFSESRAAADSKPDELTIHSGRNRSRVAEPSNAASGPREKKGANVRYDYLSVTTIPEYVARLNRYREEHECRLLFQRIVRAVFKYHAKNAHRRNIYGNLTMDTFWVAIPDFLNDISTYKVYVRDSAISCRRSSSRACSVNQVSLAALASSPFAAPELCYSQTDPSSQSIQEAPSADIWSLGVILYLIICGVSPFRVTNKSLVHRLKDAKWSGQTDMLSVKRLGHVEFDVVVPSVEAQVLIRWLLDVDPQRRPSTITEILQHSWLQNSRLQSKTQGDLQSTLEVFRELDHVDTVKGGRTKRKDFFNQNRPKPMPSVARLTQRERDAMHLGKTPLERHSFLRKK